MPYVLARRQKRLYQYQATIKRVLDISAPGDLTGRYSVIESAVDWYLQSTPDTSVPSDIGLVAQDNLFVLDYCHFPQGVDIQVGDYFMCSAQPVNPISKLPAFDLVGLWWAVRSNFRPHYRLANKQVIEAKRVINRGATVTVGVNSATQPVSSTQGLVSGSLIFFPGATVFRSVDHVADATHVVLTASVLSVTGELLRLPPPGV